MKTKIAGLVITTTILISTTHSAYALSCVRPDPVRECKQMLDEKMSPVWASGQLSLKKIISQEKNKMNIGSKGPAVAEYHFTGIINDDAGKRDIKGAKVIISTSCAGPWCASLPADKKSGYFLLKNAATEGLKLHLGACSFQPFEVTEQQAKEMEACVTPNPIKPKVVKNTGGSQIFSQGNKNKKLVE